MPPLQSAMNIKPMLPAPLEQENLDSDSQTIQTSEPAATDPVAKVFNIPEVLEVIVKALPPHGLLNFARTNRGFYYFTKPVLMHTGLRKSSSVWLRRLADVVPVEQLRAKLKGKTFIFECLLKGMFKGTFEVPKRQEKALSKLLECLLPLKDQKDQNLREGTEGILTEKNIKDIVASIVPSEDPRTQAEKKPTKDEKLKALEDSGLLSAQQIQQLQAHGGATEVKVDHLCKPNVILMLLQEPKPEPDFIAFTQISDDDIQNKGILKLLMDLHHKEMEPEESRRTEQVIANMGKSKLFVNVCNKRERFPLQEAMEHLHRMLRSPSQVSKQIQVIRTLLRYDAQPNQRDHKGMTALHYAADWGNIELLQVLLDHDAKINQRDHKGMTALHYAADWGNIELLQVLLDHDAKINQPDDGGMTALHYAATFGNNELLQVLLDHGAKINQLDHEKMSVLHYTARQDNFEGFLLLINESGGRELLHWRNKKGESLMELAGGPTSMIGQWLIKEGVEQLTTKLDVMHIA